MSTGMRHVLEGYIRAASNIQVPAWYIKWFTPLQITYKKAIVFGSSFGLIYLIAQTNPQGFLIVLENFTSFGLNLESGVFISWMLGNARSKYSHIDVVFNVPPILYRFRYVVVFYFLLAIFYDVEVVCASLFAGYK